MRTPCLLLLALAPACVEPALDARSSALDDDELPAIAPRVVTASLHAYEDAPRTPDADDPAIWLDRRGSRAPLVIGVLKDGGIAAYDLDGRLVQALPVARRPPLPADAPPAPGPQPDPGTGACPDSASGETFGRYNNVAIVSGFPLRRDGRVRRIDLALVTDRGCDRLRAFAIEPGAPGGPLVDVTAPDAPRVFPRRFTQPSPRQAPGEPARVEPNPVDDQHTAYGLAVYPRGHDRFDAAVTQRGRAVIGLVELRATADGRVSYRGRAELRVDPVFRLRAPGGGWLAWTPCREDLADDPQLEGLVFDESRRVLWATQEVIGLWAIPLPAEPRGVYRVGPRHLVDRVRGFGAPWWAIPAEDGAWSCEDAAPVPAPAGTVAGPGDPSAGGHHLEADAEGVTLVRDPDDGEPREVLVSSQGDDSFHRYDLDDGDHLGGFRVTGVSGTDGVELVTAPVGRRFPGGLLVVHDGDAAPPTSTDPIGGFAYDGSTGFAYVGWDEVEALD